MPEKGKLSEVFFGGGDNLFGLDKKKKKKKIPKSPINA